MKKFYSYLEGKCVELSEPSTRSTLEKWILVQSLSLVSVSPRLTAIEAVSSSTSCVTFNDTSWAGDSINSNLSGDVEFEFNVWIVPEPPC